MKRKSNAVPASKPSRTPVPLRKDKLFKRKLILLGIILFLFILLIIDKEYGLFVKIFGDRTIQFRKPSWWP